jgi:hypothetical protein
MEYPRAMEITGISPQIFHICAWARANHKITSSIKMEKWLRRDSEKLGIPRNIYDNTGDHLSVLSVLMYHNVIC